MVPFENLDTVSYSHCIATMAVSCIVSEIKRYIGRKSRVFHTLCIRQAGRQVVPQGDPPGGRRQNIVIEFGTE